MFWKKSSSAKAAADKEEKNIPPKNSHEKVPRMGLVQRLAMRRLSKMDPREREKMMQQALSPESIAKNKDKILAVMEKMKESGTINEEQIKLAKEKLGL